jgi:hypothetical protein
VSAFVINSYAFGIPTSVSFVGIEEGSPGNNYAVQNWSNPGVSKTYSVGGTNKYGNAGYYLIRPVSPFDIGGSVSIFESAPTSNNLGISATTYPTLHSAPQFATVVGNAGSYVNFNGYSIFRSPNGSDLVRIGALSVATDDGSGGFLQNSFEGQYGILCYVTLTQSVKFRLGLVVDSINDATYVPWSISIYNSKVGVIESAEIDRNGSSDIVFFDINGNEGETFEVRGWQANSALSVTALSLITFDLL